MKLMPQADIRICRSCGHTWDTAYPGETACAKCGFKLLDVSELWPHACAKGHEAIGGGDCKPCEARK